MKKIYIKTLLIIQFAILLLPACGQKGPLPPADTVAPQVSLISPTNGAQNVPINSSIVITFSEDMAAATINGQTITLSTGSGNVPGTITYSDKTAFFKPASDLNPNTMYTVAVDGSVTDEAGNPMVTPFGYIFITGAALDTTPPAVSATNPSDGAQNVSPNVALSVTFSEPVSQSTITFLLSSGGVEVPFTMTYSGTTAIFTPSTGLAYGAQYSAVVKAGVADLAGNTMASDYSWTFATGAQPDTTPPSVISNTPGIGATDVSVNTSLNVTFSEAVDQSTIAFVLSAGSTTVPCTMSYSGTTAIFTPVSPLSYNTLYTATVKSGVKDLAGNSMTSNYFWSFKTGMAPDTTPPGVSATNPTDGAQNVPPNAALSATFTEPVDQSTITFILSDGSVTVPYTMSYNGMTAIFTPASGLAYAKQYTATVNSGVKDLAGNTMPGSYSWSFRTGNAPDTTPPSVIAKTPGAGATDVSVDTSLTVTFSEAVDQSTIIFVLSAGSTTVPCTITYSGTTANFTHASPLSYNTLYTATVNSGVKDLAGNTMSSDYSWSFTTGQQPTFTITASAGPNGSISPMGSVSVNNGSSQSFTITPDTGYHIADVTVDSVSVGALGSYTFTNVQANHSIAASFAINTYTVTPSVNGGNGSINPSVPQTVNYSSTTTFTITSDPGFTAVMSGTCGGSLVGTTYTTNAITANCTVEARFSINTNTVTASAGQHGSISPSGSVAVDYNGSQIFTITPDPNYHVADVLVDGSSVGAVTSYQFTNVTANHTIAASFAITTYTITASAGSNGDISPSGSVTVNSGTNQTFTFTPNTGYYVSNVTVDGSPVPLANSYTFYNVAASHSISVSFALLTFTITPTAGPGGSLAPSTQVLLDYGGSQTFTITPDANYHVADVVVDGSSKGAVASYTFTNVTANHTIVATFAINTFTVTPSVTGGHGGISPNTVQTVNYNGTTAFTLTPATGYHVVTPVGGSCGGTLVGNIYTTNTVTANCTVTASFTLNTYTITATAGTGGSINPSGDVIVDYNTNKKFTITPLANYHIADVLVDSTSVGAIATYTFTNIKDNHTIEARFAIDTYTVTPSVSGGNGSITPDTVQTVDYDGTTSFTLTPITGYHINTVTGTCGGSLSGSTYTTNLITRNCTVVASFAINTYTITATVGTGGSISPSGSQTVNYGADPTFTITADPGYAVSDVLVDSVSQGAVTSYQFIDVAAEHTISASFASQ